MKPGSFALVLFSAAVLSSPILRPAESKQDARAETPKATAEPKAKDAMPLFSPKEVEKLYKEKAPPKPAVKEPAADDPDGAVVELEPYVVEGDGGLMMARFRRQWDLGPVSIRKRVTELDEALGDQIEFSGRASEQFFSAQSPGGPADRQDMFPVPVESLKPLSRTIIDAVSGDKP